MRSVTERRVRVELGQASAWGRLDGETIVLEDGRTVPEVDARYLAPVTPSLR